MKHLQDGAWGAARLGSSTVVGMWPSYHTHLGLELARSPAGTAAGTGTETAPRGCGGSHLQGQSREGAHPHPKTYLASRGKALTVVVVVILNL